MKYTPDENQAKLSLQCYTISDGPSIWTSGKSRCFKNVPTQCSCINGSSSQ